MKLFFNAIKAVLATAAFICSALLSPPLLAGTMPDSGSGIAMTDLALITTGSEHHLLTTNIHVASQKELVFDFAVECGLLTKTEVKSKGGNKDTSVAEATVKINIKVYDEDGAFVGYAYPGGMNDDGTSNGVTFCHRTQELSAVFQGLLSDEDGNVCLKLNPLSGLITIDEDCLRPEEVSLLLSTMNANAFNFVTPNLKQGTYRIEVIADINTGGSAQEGSYEAKALLGRASLIVDEVRLIKDDDGQL